MLKRVFYAYKKHGANLGADLKKCFITALNSNADF